MKWLLQRAIVFVGLFFLCWPIFYFMVRPFDDVTYHLFEQKCAQIAAGDPLRHNQFVEIVGELDKNSVYVSSRGIVSRNHGYFCRFKQGPSKHIVYLGAGELHNALSNVTNFSGKIDFARLDDSIYQNATVRGRVHQSGKTMIVPFGTIKDSEDTGISKYLRSKNLSLDGDPVFVIVADELPGYFSDSNGATFFLGFGISFFVLGGIVLLQWFKSRRRDQWSNQI